MPLEELYRIRQKGLTTSNAQTGAKASQKKKLLQESISELRKRLDLSREEVSKWFPMIEKLKSELESLKGVNCLLRVKFDEQRA